MINSNENNLQVKLNALKHHASFLRFRLEQWRKKPWNIVKEELQELGNNQFDVYTGELTVDEILTQVNEILTLNKLKTREDLKNWLGKACYRTILLSDCSRWVIREGESELKPVHLHPGRNQLHVKRIRATHLKTAVALIYENRENTSSLQDCTTQKINHIRITHLELSPVKSVEDCHRILETIKFLEIS
jgi:hypothetical protein